MSLKLRDIITATDRETRDTSLEAICEALSFDELIAECKSLDLFRRESENLYERVRALFFLYAIYRFYLPAKRQKTALQSPLRRTRIC